MSETTVANLPEEVLSEVFKWLDSESLKNVKETSGEWKEIVERFIPLTLELYSEGNMETIEPSVDSLLASERKYNKAIIWAIWGWPEPDKILKIFEKHGATIAQLDLQYTTLEATIWCELLKTMPKLKKVKMFLSSGGVSFEYLNAADLPNEKDLNKLESVKLSRCATTVLKLFDNSQLKTLSVRWSVNEGRELLIEFLATQKCLEELKLSFDELFKAPIPDKIFPFRLKKLVLDQMYGYETPHHNNLLKFLKMHAATLEGLELSGKIHDAVYEFAFGKLKQLKTLRLRGSNFPYDLSFYERLEVNRSVTSLRIECGIGMIAAKGLINHLPNIETLLLDNIRDRSVIKHVGKTLKMLKKLDVRHLCGRAIDKLRFEGLESLEVRYVTGKLNWAAVSRNNPGIKELVVWTEERLDIKGITKNLKKLHSLTIETKLNCDEKFFDIIRQNCKELKSLILDVESLQVDIATVADIPGLRFRNFTR